MILRILPRRTSVLWRQARTQLHHDSTDDNILYGNRDCCGHHRTYGTFDSQALKLICECSNGGSDGSVDLFRLWWNGTLYLLVGMMLDRLRLSGHIFFTNWHPTQ